MATISEAKIEKKRLATLYNQSNVALPGSLFVAICISVLFWNKIEARFLVLWLAAMGVVLLARLITYLKYKSLKKDPRNPRYWFLIYGISTSAGGALWGIFGMYAHFHTPMVYLSITLIILAGLIAASVATNAASLPIYFGFSLPAIGPVAISLILSGEFEKSILGLLALVYLWLTSQSAIQLNRVILQSLTYRYEKLQLLDDLQKEKAQVLELNKQLSLDIEHRKQTEKEKEILILQLRNALSEVKTLSGLIPICAQCKKVRDDKGYWSQIESFIHEHSNADFSHGICPDCAKELYPDINFYDD